ncbi:MAG TPA: molybdopterin-dependent oxidoreductase [Thermoanaerobaculia bacterium]|nr:molybdopterin-dependent oxidoreductase [Thermoanaerobaculia bacterium]
MSATTFFGKHAGILVRQEDPFNAGPAPEMLRRGFITPNELFFVRNHGAVPQVDPATWRLAVGGMVKRPLRFSLEELRRLPKVTVTATLQCAGNRRAELTEVAPIPNELGWGTEAISTGVWGGVPLRELLAAVEPLPPSAPSSDNAHVAFTGLDETERHGVRFQFGGSIPLDKAMRSEVLLAYEMNGEPLPPVHGAPLRAVVPGYIGARSVKWLSTITVQDRPSDNYFQAKAYRLFPADVNAENVDWESGLMLGELPVNSVICSPGDGESLAAGTVAVRGYAAAGGGREVARVDLSTDGGRSWTAATVLPEDGRWAWRLWEGRLELPAGEHEIVCRAWDSAAQTQPEHPSQVWNFKGYMNNAWHRVRVTCVD